MPMFAKRHYEVIAEVMQATHGCHGWATIRDELADVFYRDNPKFNTARFENACLPGQNVKARTAHLKYGHPG